MSLASVRADMVFTSNKKLTSMYGKQRSCKRAKRELQAGICSYLHGILVAIPDSAEDIFSFPCPPDGAARQGDHAKTLLDPLAPGHLGIHVYSFLGYSACQNCLVDHWL